MLDEQSRKQIGQELAGELRRYLVSEVRPKLLTVSQAAIYLNRTRSAVYHLVGKRELRFIKHGRCLRFEISALDAYIARGRE